MLIVEIWGLAPYKMSSSVFGHLLKRTARRRDQDSIFHALFPPAQKRRVRTSTNLPQSTRILVSSAVSHLFATAAQVNGARSARANAPSHLWQIGQSKRASLFFANHSYVFFGSVCRRSLVLELQATRALLVSSLNKVQGLELESRKVGILQGRIKELERNLRKASKR